MTRSMISRISIFVLCFSFMAFCIPTPFAVPVGAAVVTRNLAPPNPLVYPDFYASDAGVYESGSELSSYSRLAPQFAQQLAAPNYAPAAGTTLKVLVIPVAFSDKAFSAGHDTAYYQNVMNDMRLYYVHNSNYVAGSSGITITPTIAPFVTLANTMAFYGADSLDQYGNRLTDKNENGVINRLARDAVLALDPSFDFSPYDTNSDGRIDHLMIVHAGEGQESSADTDTIWSHQWQINTSTIVDGVSAVKYTCLSENSTVGIFAHEFGHDIGLPDLYDTNGAANGDSHGTGAWELMSSGSWNRVGANPAGSSPANLSPWSRIQMGWVTPVEVSANGNYTLENTSGLSTVLRVWANGTVGGNEYYLIEYRRNIGYDAGLPGWGVLIWHVDNAQITALGGEEINRIASRLGLSIEQADGNFQLERDINAGDSGDSFTVATGRNAFTAVPYGLNYSNITPTSSNYVEANIVQISGDQATVTINMTPTAPTSAPIVSLPVPAAFVPVEPTFRWTPVPLAQYYLLQISTDSTYATDVLQIPLTTNEDGLSYQGSDLQYTLPFAYRLSANTDYYWRIGARNSYSTAGNSLNTSGVLTTRTTPVLSFSFSGANAGRLMGAVPGMEFSQDGGTVWTGVTEIDQLLPGNQLESITAANDIRLKWPARNGFSETSTAMVDILTGPAAPAITFSLDGVNARKLVGATTDMVYSQDGGTSWTAVSGTDQALSAAEWNSLTAVNDLKIRLPGIGLTSPGASTTIDLLTGPAAPDVTHDDTNNTVSGMTTSMTFSTDGLNWTTYTSTEALPDLSGLLTLRVRIIEVGLTLPGSTRTLSFTIPAPLAPTVTFAFDGDNPLRMMGTNSSMEFSINGGTVWTSIAEPNMVLSSASLAALSPANGLHIRIKANGETPAGLSTIIPLTAGPAAPAVTRDDAANTVSGITTEMEYSTNGSSWTVYAGSLPDLSGNLTVMVRVPATGTTLPGTIVSLSFTVPAPVISPPSGGLPPPPPPPPPAPLPVVVPGGLNLAVEEITAAGDVLKVKLPTDATEPSIVVGPDALDALLSSDKTLEMQIGKATISVPSDAISADVLNKLGMDSSVKWSVEQVLPADAPSLPTQSAGGTSGLFSVGGTVYSFSASAISGEITQAITEFSKPLTISIALSNNALLGVDTDKLGAYWYNQTKKIWVYMGGSYNPKTGMFSFETPHFSIYAVMRLERTFTDIKGHWAQTDIEKMASRQIANGVGKDLFAPNNTITRAEFLALLVRSVTLPTSSSSSQKLTFADVPLEKWYAKELLSALQAGIVTSSDGVQFRPDAIITRSEMTQMISRTLLAVKPSLALAPEFIVETLSRFKDAADIPAGFEQPVALAVSTGIIKGTTVDTFSPLGKASRAEGIVMIRRLLTVLGVLR